MKYLKEYNEIGWYNNRESYLEDLSDCLQEIFDRYNIRQFDENNKDYFYSTWYYRINRNNYEIVIENIGDLKYQLLSDIKKARTTIKSRINSDIEIIEKKENIHQGARLVIRLYPLKNKSLIENNEYNSSLIEDLSDYLQEAFDKFDIKQTTLPRTNIYDNMKDNTWCIAFQENEHFYGCIYIKTNNDNHYNLFDYLTSLKGLKERLGKELVIWESHRYNMINISIPGDENKVYHPSFPKNESLSLHDLKMPLGPFPGEFDFMKYTLDADGKLKPELEDCLIEVFDKFNIPQRPKGSLEFSWNGDHYGYIIINHIPIKKFHYIFEELVKFHPMIEKRIKHKVYISSTKSNDKIFICIGIPRNKINESKNDSQNKLEELSEYLQEFFDKFNIRECIMNDVSDEDRSLSDFWYLTNRTICMSIQHNNRFSLLNELKKNQNTIEKRLGKLIRIMAFEDSILISIHE